MFVQLNEWLLDVCSLATFSYSVKFPAVRVTIVYPAFLFPALYPLTLFATPLPRASRKPVDYHRRSRAPPFHRC